MDYFVIFLTITAQRSFDRNYLHGVQHGFEGSGVGLPWSMVLILAALALTVILLLLVLARFLKPSKYSFGRHKNDFITKISDIRDIIERAVMLRAVFDIEVYDDNYKEVYKGQVLGINNDRQIEVELSSFTDPNLDFKDKNVHVAFRMSRRGRQEFFHFNTVTRYIGITNNFGRRERSVRLVFPKRIELGQKRRYIRVEPAGRFRFTAKFFGSLTHDKVMPLKSFFFLHEADVNDISIGGLQTIIQARSNEIKLKSGDIVYVRFKLPAAGLKVSNLPNDFFFKGHVIGVERLVVGRGGNVQRGRRKIGRSELHQNRIHGQGVLQPKLQADGLQTGVQSDIRGSVTVDSSLSEILDSRGKGHHVPSGLGQESLSQKTVGN